MPRVTRTRTRTVRRSGFRAAAVGGAAMAYEGGRRVYRKVANTVSSMRRQGGLIKYARNFTKSAANGDIGRAIMGQSSGGDYSQFTSKNIKTGRKERLTLRNIDRHLRKSEETTVFKWNAVKNFDDYGYNPCGRNISNVNETQMPLYVYDLTAVNNYINGIATNATPCLRAKVVKATGEVKWDLADNYYADGATVLTSLQTEKYSAASPANLPLERSRLRWADVRMNLWGSKNKAHKFIIQIIKVLDDDIDPFEKAALRANDLKHTPFWQSMLKPLTFNPVSTSASSDRHTKDKIKILKSFTKIIQPTSSTENDVDPHAFTLKWFMRWNRDLIYTENGVGVGTYADLSNQADYALNVQTHSTQTRPKYRIYLLVRASVYTEFSGFDNTISPSFDLAVRTLHEINN